MPKLHAASAWERAVWTLCLAGALARIAAYAQNRSLWYDEAALALNLARRSYLALLAPLDNLQTAPLIFLWAERAAVAVFGLNEWSLRALPLVAGIATGPMMWRVARRLLPVPAAVLSVAFVTLSPSLVRYSAEVKPYGLDALVTLILLDRAVATTQPNARSRQWWMLAGAGIVAVVCSTPAVFVLAGVIAFLVVHAARTRNAVIAQRAVNLCAGWAVTIALVLATVLRPLVTESAAIGRFMRWYWAANFLTPGPPGLATKASVMFWAVLTNTFFGATALPNATTLLVAMFAFGGIMLFAKRRFAELALLVVPIAAVVTASTLRLYPIAERLVLFAAPLSAMLMASSLLVFVGRDGRSRSVWLTAVPNAVIAILAVRGVMGYLSSDAGKEETRALVRTAAQQHAVGKPVWVSGGGEAAWRFYSGQIVSETQPSETGPLSPPGRSIAPGVLVGAWYRNMPERILRTENETKTESTSAVWGETEALRVRQIARPCVLLLISQTQPAEATTLLSSAARLGGRVVQSWRAPGAAMHDLCFAQPVAAGAQ